MRTLNVRVLLVVAMVACGPVPPRSDTQPGQSLPSVATLPPPSAVLSSPTPVPTAPALPRVFLIVMENTGLARALGAAPIARLASANMLATNYFGVARPSLPNYLAMTSGSTWGITDNGYHVLPTEDLGTQLTTAGISWRAYNEGLTDAGCLRSPYPYALKHNPFAYYGGSCPPNVVPLTLLATDLAGDAPSFVWIKPGLCNDGHDCSLGVAGAWLENTVSQIVSSRAWVSTSVLFIVWEEGDGGDNNLVPLIVITPDGTAGRNDTRYDHYSLLATIQDLFGLPRLGAARTARPLTDLIGARR